MFFFYIMNTVDLYFANVKHSQNSMYSPISTLDGSKVKPVHDVASVARERVIIF